MCVCVCVCVCVCNHENCVCVCVCVCVIMKTMCPPVYHHNGFVATHALGYMTYTYLFTSLNNFSSAIRLNMQQKIL